MLIARFKSGSPYANQRVVFEGDVVRIEGSGEVDVRHLVEFDRAGELLWEADELRELVYERAWRAAIQEGDIATSPRSAAKQRWFALLMVSILILILICLGYGCCGVAASLQDPATRFGDGDNMEGEVAGSALVTPRRPSIL